MTINKDVVLWDNGKDRLCLLPVTVEKQYKYIDGLPCVTFGISYENANYKGYDIFTLFDCFYVDTLRAIDEVYRCVNGAFRITDNGADTDGFIDFAMNNGLLSVKGRLGASFSLHSLAFEFEADQTLLGVLLQTITIQPHKVYFCPCFATLAYSFWICHSQLRSGSIQTTKSKPNEVVLIWRGRIIPPVDVLRLAAMHDPAVLF